MAARNLNIDWKKYYDEHHGTVEDAAKLIENGDTIWMGQASCIPYVLLDYLTEHRENYKDVTIIYNVMNAPTDMIFEPDIRGHFRLFSSFNLPLERMSMDMNIVECGGMSYDLFEFGPFAYDSNMAAVQLCPPDEEGWCNAGAYGVCNHGMLVQDPRIKKKIGFIDPTGQYPVPGDRETHYIHITELDCIVDNPTELMVIPAAPPTDKDVLIAGHILPYLKEGDKIQIGFGGLGEEILKNLRGVGKVEVFSEVACESMMPLCKEGIITKITACSPAACSREFFEWAAKDERVHFFSKDVCIDPLSIMQQENIVAINATFMVDLLGQCCSEAQGLSPYSGPGGSFAYLYGAIRAKGGRSFVCLRSTYVDKDGETQSNIVPWLPAGCIVTTTKIYTMYIVSEYGVADVFMKTLKDRIKALIKIAHPDFRKDLMEKIVTTPLIKEEDFEGYDAFDNVK